NSLTKDTSLMAPLDDVAERTECRKTRPTGSAPGNTLPIYDDNTYSCIAAASVTPERAITSTPATVAADLGALVAPEPVRSQTAAGVTCGLRKLLLGGIDIVGGGTAEASLDTTHCLRFNEVPEIDVALISTDNNPGALGEIGCIAVAGSVANALSRASGVGQY